MCLVSNTDFDSLSPFNFINKNQLHAVSRTQQGRQREPSIKTLHSPLSAEFLEVLRVEWRNSTLRFVSTPEQSGNIYLNKYFISSSGDRTHKRRVAVTSLCPWATTASILITS